MKFEKKKLTLRRKYLITQIISTICRIIFKLWLTVVIAMIFAEIGVGYTIWTKIVSWLISWYISRKLFNWIMVREFGQEMEYYSEVRDLFNGFKQLIFYTTDEKSS